VLRIGEDVHLDDVAVSYNESPDRERLVAGEDDESRVFR
jgi:hypothetical protein